jgi:hypothetical protein
MVVPSTPRLDRLSSPDDDSQAMPQRAEMLNQGFRPMRKLGIDLSISFVLLLILIPACLESEPPRPYNSDMGDEGRPLPPTAASWTDPAVRNGTAEWMPFQPADPAAGPRPEPPSASRETEETPAGEPSPTEAAVRAFIKDFNAVVAEKNFKELPAYFVRDQRGKVRDLLATGDQFLEKFDGLLNAIEEKSPGAAEPLRRFQTLAAATQSRELNVEALTVVSPTEVTARIVPPPGLTVPEEVLAARFLLRNDQWEVELKQIELAAASWPAIQAMIERFDSLIEAVQSGAVPVETVVQQLSAGLAAIMPPSESPPAETPPSSEGD